MLGDKSPVLLSLKPPNWNKFANDVSRTLPFVLLNLFTHHKYIWHQKTTDKKKWKGKGERGERLKWEWGKIETVSIDTKFKVSHTNKPIHQFIFYSSAIFSECVARSYETIELNTLHNNHIVYTERKKKRKLNSCHEIVYVC